MSRVHSILALIFSIILAQSVGLIGSLATRPNIESWYRLIDKPGFTPPDWVFAVVWPALFLLMAVAAWLVYRTPPRASRDYWRDGASYESMFLKKRPSRLTALTIYVIHLFFNMGWSFLFFKWQLPGVALVEILILLGLLLVTTRLFYRISTLAGYLMVPYILWVGYATVLNGALWWMNM